MKRKGKVICQHLKDVSRNIAAENGIHLTIDTPDGPWTLGDKCHYKGECSGTCPRCEAELRYLEEALANRVRLGKIATVAGLALGLATGAQAQQEETKNNNASRDSLVRMERPSFPLIDNTLVSDGNKTMEQQTGTLRGESNMDYSLGTIRKRRHMKTPWESIQNNSDQLVGAIGYQDMGHGNVEVERRGTLLIAVEPEKTEL